MSIYRTRRQELIKNLQAKGSSEGVILLMSNFERDGALFRQESSFYYFTGITEPGVFLLIDFSGKTTLYVPCYPAKRSAWVTGTISLDADNVKLDVDQISFLGDPLATLALPLLFTSHDVSKLIHDLKVISQAKENIYTCIGSSPRSYVEQKIVLSRLEGLFVDIADSVASLRRIKSRFEIDQLVQAVECTMVAQSGASQLIESGKSESEIQATIEYLYTEAGGRPAFPTSVASGKNGTILHYTLNKSQLKNGDLVVIDTGAEIGHYCADITRTYPVSGVFTKRQRHLYNVVLDTQKFVASRAKPGYWLNNKEYPEKSLHHLAVHFLMERDLDPYFIHGIGHFLGLDVHDVGNPTEPLQVGDVITLEPGVYIPEENSGIRIEDNYQVVHNGLRCLSKDLPQEADEIELMMQESDEDDSDYE
jgi:Xaa-Pro aminopeptidase